VRQPEARYGTAISRCAMGAVVFVGDFVGWKHDRAHKEKRLLGLVNAFVVKHLYLFS